MKIFTLEQSGDVWKDWRSQGIGSSDAATLAGVSPWMNEQDLHEISSGKKQVKENYRMKRGTLLEPYVRQLYIQSTGNKCRPVCVIHDKHDWLRASLDGLTYDNKRIVEIKCPSDSAHYKAVKGKIPRYYYPQIQHQFMVTLLDRLDYVSYSTSKRFTKEEQLVILEFKPDVEYIKSLFKAEKRHYRMRKYLNKQ